MPSEAFLLNRILLRFDKQSLDLLQNISAAALSPDGNLWIGSDELNTLERLSPLEPYGYGAHQSIAIAHFIDLVNQDEEIDVEGMDYASHYLWFTGSHSTKRKRTKGKNSEKDIQRLAEVTTELNRYLIARIPLINGELVQSCPHPDKPEKVLTTACLQKTETGNVLIEALQNDLHLGAYISSSLPSKENGFDIEGLAVYKNRIFLGLRGPVLRGWAIILEIQVEASEPGILTLCPFEKTGKLYQKHFLNLDGLGVRELCFCKDDLLILAGPSMDLAGATRVFRLKNVRDRTGDNLYNQGEGELDIVFDLPFHPTGDKAEGLVLLPGLGQSQSLLVLYDAPDANRLLEPESVLVDVFKV